MLFRIATYNVHKCQGLDRRVRPQRIADVLREIDADIIALQEVLGEHEHDAEANHLRRIADELEMDFRVGANRRLHNTEYGNAVLTRHRLIHAQNHDITRVNREPRGCLQVDVDIKREAMNRAVRVFNVHLGTSFMERRFQAQRLLSMEHLGGNSATLPRIVLGDFNEWTHGLASRLFQSHFASADPDKHLPARRFSRARTYPGVLPFLHLDHIYYDRTLELINLSVHRNSRSLIASDHLPLVADFRLK